MEPICFTILGLLDYHFHSTPEFEIEDMKHLDGGERVKKLRDFLKTTLEYYKSANKRTESTLKQLHLHRDKVHFESRVRLAQFGMLHDVFNTKQCTAAAFSLSYINFKKRKNNLKYTKMRLNHSISTYQLLLVKMYRDLRYAQRNLENCKKEIIDTSASETDIDSLKVKIHLYQGELKKLDNCNSWINEKQWSYDYLNWQIQGLKYLKYEKNEIQKELDRYQGLRPDLFEAAQQILEMENTCKEFFRKLSEYK